jgi:hypothetical protein
VRRGWFGPADLWSSVWHRAHGKHITPDAQSRP